MSECIICKKEYHGGFVDNTCSMECMIRFIIRDEFKKIMKKGK